MVVVAMNSSSTIISSLISCSNLKWFLFFFLFFLFFSPISLSSSTPPKISYSDHCDSIIPQSNPTDRDYTYPFLRTTTIHFTGGEKILGKISSDKSLSFRTTRVFKTDTIGVYKIEANLIFRSISLYVENSTYDGSFTSRSRFRRKLLRFLLNGFWSESSGKLCMVGSASGYSREEGKLLSVLKLNYVDKNSTIFTSLIGGSLESVSSSSHDPSYFEPISILALSELSNYKYTMVSEEFNKSCSGGTNVPPSSSLSLQPTGLCRSLSAGLNTFKLEYSSKCNSAKNCTPFGDGIGYLPHMISLKSLQCSEDENSLRYLIEFQKIDYVMYNQPFDPNTTLIAEGSWDRNKNRLCIVACRILTDSLGNTHVGDCSIRLSIRYPAIWSIGDSSNIVGEIWTNKTSNNSEYFDRMQFRSSENNNMVNAIGLKYEYTQMDKVRRSCPVTKKPLKKKWEKYPDGDSYDMRFDMSVKNRKENFAWGYVYPIFVGSRLYEPYSVMDSAPLQAYSESEVEEGVPVVETNKLDSGPLNISYTITFNLFPGMKWDSGMSSLNFSSNYNDQVEISAEGVYDTETGKLCMVGCRKLQSYSQKSTNDSVDCEILVNFQFSPVNGGRNGGFIKGSIQSMRNSTDLLYFEVMNISSNAYYATEAKKSIWRMDLEIALVLISNTLACLFVVFQLFYVRNHPDVLPSISVVMLVILTLGYMIPLVLNFDALFLGGRNQQNVLIGSGGWIEANEVIVRVVTMIAFLLQFRLLQRVWSARSSDGSQKGSWIAEKKALFVSLPLYIVGVLAALFVNWRKNEYVDIELSSGAYIHHQHSLWGDLKSYGGLILDGFLFPQILLNIFRISRENVLSPSFYLGTTSVRVLPHAYDLYRTHNYVPQHVNGSYIYANPSADFYSTSWDIIIPCGGMLFAAIIYLQQRFGGHYILPQRFRKPEMYEQVPELAMN